MNASTATIYRHSLDREMDEASGELGGGERDAPDTWRFSIEVAGRWERAFFAGSYAGHTKGRASRRHGDECRTRRNLRFIASAGALRAWRPSRILESIRFVD